MVNEDLTGSWRAFRRRLGLAGASSSRLGAKRERGALVKALAFDLDQPRSLEADRRSPRPPAAAAVAQGCGAWIRSEDLMSAGGDAMIRLSQKQPIAKTDRAEICATRAAKLPQPGLQSITQE